MIIILLWQWRFKGITIRTLEWKLSDDKNEMIIIKYMCMDNEEKDF